MRNIQLFCVFIADIIRSRSLILELTKKDFQARYLGSYLGITWAFIQPAINIVILWFVFEKGFKSAPIDKFPFILWLIAGIIPWFFISDSISSATSSVIDNSYLVKKVVFRVSILPIIKLLSALFIHSIFMVIIIITFVTYGFDPNVYTLQIVYYVFCSIVLILGITWMTSALIVFLKDIGQLVTMFLQFFFWLTPIFWSIGIVPAKFQGILRLNPFYYVIDGYRESLIYHRWFWEDMNATVHFWALTISLFVLGAFLFRRLRPHFADVL